MRRRSLLVISNLLLTFVSAFCLFVAGTVISGFNAGSGGRLENQA